MEESQGGTGLCVGQHLGQASGSNDRRQHLGPVGPAAHQLLVDIDSKQVALVGGLDVVLGQTQTRC